MQQEIRYRRHTDAQDALLLAWVLILGVFGVLYFVAYDRLHVRPGQLIEMTIYPTPWSCVPVGGPAVQGNTDRENGKRMAAPDPACDPATGGAIPFGSEETVLRAARL